MSPEGQRAALSGSLSAEEAVDRAMTTQYHQDSTNGRHARLMADVRSKGAHGGETLMRHEHGWNGQK